VANAGSWKPGQSGNPAGRKPNPETLTVALRGIVDPREWAAKLKRMAFSEKYKEETNLAALREIGDRLLGKPRVAYDVNLTDDESPRKTMVELLRQMTQAQLPSDVIEAEYVTLPAAPVEQMRKRGRPLGSRDSYPRKRRET
jgi:hypothetical protein